MTKKEETKIPNYANVAVKNLPNSMVEIEGEIKAEIFEIHRETALKALVAEAEIPGFRKGMAPEKIVLEHYSDALVLERAAGAALDAEYYTIISDNSIRAIGEPQITITKLAKGNPLGFKVTTAVFPEIALPNYKKIAAGIMGEKEEVIEVTDKEVEGVVEEIAKAKAHETLHAVEGHSHTDHNHDLSKYMPEINDDFAKSVGDFATVADMKEKIKANMIAEKTYRAKEKRRIAVLEKLIEECKAELPEIMIEAELEKMLAQFKEDVARGGLTLEQYLEHVKKTIVDLKKEWRDIATKRALSQIMLGAIAKEENLKPSEEEVKKEMDHVLAHHKDADRFRVRMFVENMLQNDRVLKFLEEQK